MSFLSGFLKKAKLKSELQPHQERVLRKLESAPGMLVYHGLGSGKTLTSLAVTDGEKTDVVVPASLRENYKKEVKKHTVGHNPDVMSFEGFLKEERNGEGRNLVVDEVHLAGRPDSKRSQLLMKAAPQYNKKILLTGTPMRNHPHELGPLIKMIRGDSEIPSDKKEFEDKFVQEITTKPNFFARKLLGRTPSTTYKIKNEEKFKNLVNGIVDYHENSKDGFPEVETETIEVPLEGEQQKMYNYLIGKMGPAMRYKIRKGLPPSKQESKQLNAFLSGVRQVSNTARPFGGTQEDKIRRAVLEHVEAQKENPRHKTVVYSNYRGAGILPYAERLEAEGVPYAVFDGTLSDAKRKKVVEDYNKGKINALLISGAGAQGLDLKGTRLMQILEPHWNQSRIDQVIGRGIRYKSHDHLPEEERKVKVQHFHSTMKPGLMDKILRRDPDTSADQYLKMLSDQKEALNNAFLNALKEEGSKDVEKHAGIPLGFIRKAKTIGMKGRTLSKKSKKLMKEHGRDAVEGGGQLALDYKKHKDEQNA